MATPIIMPKFGQMTKESAIVEWLKKEGDKVNKATFCSPSRPTNRSWRWKVSRPARC